MSKTCCTVPTMHYGKTPFGACHESWLLKHSLCIWIRNTFIYKHFQMYIHLKFYLCHIHKHVSYIRVFIKLLFWLCCVSQYSVGLHNLNCLWFLLHINLIINPGFTCHFTQSLIYHLYIMLCIQFINRTNTYMFSTSLLGVIVID